MPTILPQSTAHDPTAPLLIPEDSPGTDHRVVAALRERGILHWIRQSSTRQKEHNLGSFEEQLGQVRNLAPYGLAHGHPKILLMDARGESGKRRDLAEGGMSERKLFEQLLEEMASNRYGLLLVYVLNRIGRNAADAYRFLSVIQEHRILIMENGRVLNPRDRNDRLQIMIKLQIADFVGEEDAEKLQRARRLEAAALRLRNNLPTGLVHANPNDPEFRRRMSEAGLHHLITPEALAQHRFKSHLEKTDFYILPNPDTVVHTCATILLRLIKECGSVGALARRINEGVEGWPEGWAGHMPMTQQCIWRHNMDVRRKRATKSRLRRWLSCAALYGYFTYSAPALAEMASTRPDEELHIIRPGAFPGLAPEEDYDEIRAILRKPAKKCRLSHTGHRLFPGARRHIASRVVCAHPVASRPGGVCGYALGAMYEADGAHFYRGIQCSTTLGHRTSVSPVIEPVILDALKAVLDPAMIARGLERIRVTRTAVQVDAQALSARAEQLDRLKTQARRDGTAAGAAGRPDLQAEYQRDYESYDSELKALRLKIEAATRATEDVEQLRREDLRRIYALASDLPDLLEAARDADRLVDVALRAARERGDDAEHLRLRDYEGQVRRIIDATRLSVHLRTLDDGRVEVGVQFPSGPRVVRVVDADYFRGSQAERVWATHRLDEGAGAEVVAEEINATLPSTRVPHRRWTAARIRAAAEYHRSCEHVAALQSTGRTIEQIAAEVRATTDTVFAAAMRGALGRARFDTFGCFLVEGTTPQLHAAFPEYARRAVAAANDWPVDDVVLISELNRELTWMAVRRGATLGAGIVRDATGALYTRRSRFVRTDMDALRQKLAEPEYAHFAALDERYWVRVSEAAKLLPGVVPVTFRNHCPTVAIARGRKRESIRMVWLSPELRDRLEPVALPMAVQRLRERTGLDYRERDFVARQDAIQMLKWSGVGVSNGNITRHIETGSLTALLAKRDGRKQKVQYLHMPVHVQRVADRELVRRWLRGEFRPVPLQ